MSGRTLRVEVAWKGDRPRARVEGGRWKPMTRAEDPGHVYSPGKVLGIRPVYGQVGTYGRELRGGKWVGYTNPGWDVRPLIDAVTRCTPWSKPEVVRLHWLNAYGEEEDER